MLFLLLCVLCSLGLVAFVFSAVLGEKEEGIGHTVKKPIMSPNAKSQVIEHTEEAENNAQRQRPSRGLTKRWEQLPVLPDPKLCKAKRSDGKAMGKAVNCVKMLNLCIYDYCLIN